MKPRVGDLLIYRQGHIITRITTIGDDIMEEETVWALDVFHHNKTFIASVHSIIGVYADISREHRIKQLLNAMRAL